MGYLFTIAMLLELLLFSLKLKYLYYFSLQETLRPRDATNY